ncbi:MAG TPA: amidohydrolase family protein [Thermoanaerobaculia bacterium]|jgi:imidazolonepropionase-like amidohydrolase|nr:amidohydrolase family protein [Thermoanaerobaculia bacterium]
MKMFWPQVRPLAAPESAAAGEVVLRGVTVVNPGRERREQCRVVVRDGRIAAVEPDPQAAAPESGAFLLPGLIDMHIHLPPGSPFELSGYVTLLYLLHGITTVRDCGDADGTAVTAIREGAAKGDFPALRVFACGPFIGGGQPRWVNSVVLGGPENAEPVVARLKAEGFDFVKAYEDLTLPEIRALVAAADRHGMPLIGHVPTQLAYEEALLPSVQHFLGVPRPKHLRRDHVVERMSGWDAVDDARLDEIVAVTLEHGISNTPTLVVGQQLLWYADYHQAIEDPIVRLMPRLYREGMWHPTKGLAVYRRQFTPENLARLRVAQEKKKHLLLRLYEAGALLEVGTDTSQPFVVPGASLHQEIKLFCDAGVPLEAVWRIATAHAGEALRQPQLGRIEVGAPADLALFRQDPTRDLAALGSLEMVITAGLPYRRSDLESAAAAYRRRYENPLLARASLAIVRSRLKRVVRRDY